VTFILAGEKRSSCINEPNGEFHEYHGRGTLTNLDPRKEFPVPQERTSEQDKKQYKKMETG